MKELNCVLNSWLAEQGFETTVRGEEDAFGYYSMSDTISYALSMRETAIVSWENLMIELNCPVLMNQFYTAFLHELGHAETLHWLTEEEELFSETEEARLAEEEDVLAADYEYYHLPREIIATRWAMEYISNHLEAVRKLVELTAPLLNNMTNY